jgi:O-antigen/teichoic acid export membrane protein
MEYLFVAIDVCVAVVYTQVFKFALQTAKDHGAMTVLMQIIGAAFLLLFIPFFGWQFPTDPLPIILMVIAAVFYGISDRINTTVRSGVEASTYSIIKQLSTVFMIVAGFLFFKDIIIY